MQNDLNVELNTRQNEELDLLGCYRLLRAVIENCFTSVRLSEDKPYVVRQRRIEFARYAPLLQIFVDCTNIDEEVLRKKIIEFNE